jgi:hypothetical protein
LEITSQQFEISGLQLESCQWEHQAILLERKAELARLEATTMQEAFAIIQDEFSKQYSRKLAITAAAREWDVRFRDIEQDLSHVRRKECQLQVTGPILHIIGRRDAQTACPYID